MGLAKQMIDCRCGQARLTAIARHMPGGCIASSGYVLGGWRGPISSELAPERQLNRVPTQQSLQVKSVKNPLPGYQGEGRCDSEGVLAVLVRPFVDQYLL